MNEITAAIKKKAEDWANDGEWGYPDPDDKVNIWMFDKLREAYTCGGEEWVGIMLKFDDWRNEKYYKSWDKNIFYQRTDVMEVVPYTTEQLLIKFLEDNKL